MLALWCYVDCHVAVMWLLYMWQVVCIFCSASPAHVVQWSNHLGAMCSRAWRSQWPRIDSSLKRIISNNSYAHDDQGDNPAQENRGLDGVLYKLWPFVSDIAIFVLKRDVKLQLTNFCSVTIACRYNVIAIYVQYEMILFGIFNGTVVIQVP